MNYVNKEKIPTRIVAVALCVMVGLAVILTAPVVTHAAEKKAKGTVTYTLEKKITKGTWAEKDFNKYIKKLNAAIKAAEKECTEKNENVENAYMYFDFFDTFANKPAIYFYTAKVVFKGNAGYWDYFAEKNSPAIELKVGSNTYKGKVSELILLSSKKMNFKGKTNSVKIGASIKLKDQKTEFAYAKDLAALEKGSKITYSFKTPKLGKKQNVGSYGPDMPESVLEYKFSGKGYSKISDKQFKVVVTIK